MIEQLLELVNVASNGHPQGLAALEVEINGEISGVIFAVHFEKDSPIAKQDWLEFLADNFQDFTKINLKAQEP